jgi:UDP-GlcNAc:undecaprenyl-phosphate GlcNAc-1-phosphate transferase
MKVSPAAVEAAAAALLLTALLSDIARRLGLRYGLTDRPGDGKVHTRPTPLLGGVAIVASVLAAVGAAPPSDPRVLTILAAATVVAGLGLVDDLRPLGAGLRLTVESLAAVVVVASGSYANLFGSRSGLGYWINAAATVAWIVVITNSFNLLDNSDGAAASVAVVTSATLAALAYTSGQPAPGLLALVLASASLGFLTHNWTPARIFMGDSGSLFIGFVISATVTLVPAGASGITVAARLLLVMFVAVVDTGVVLVSRRRAGRRWRQGGADHTAHRLRRLGLSTAQTTLVLSAVSAAVGAAAFLMTRGVLPTGASFGTAAAAALMLVVAFQKVDVYGGMQAVPPRRRGNGRRAPRVNRQRSHHQTTSFQSDEINDQNSANLDHSPLLTAGYRWRRGQPCGS